MDSKGDFFKSKEIEASNSLKPKAWFIIRLDGKAFHTFTQGLNKPFDTKLSEAMIFTVKQLCAEVQNVKLAYTQSDEISLVLTDLDSQETALWFEGKIQKMVSVASSIATAQFNRQFKHPQGTLAYFDARVFRLESLDEVKAYLLWRQEDAIKNAITLVALKHYSHKQIHKKNSKEKIEMIKVKGDSISSYFQGLIQGMMISKEIRKMPFENPKTKQKVMAERSFWVEDASPDFKTFELSEVIKFRKKENS